MKKIILILVILNTTIVQAQVVMEKLMSIDVPTEKLNEYCGKYSFDIEKSLEISVELSADRMVIIIPDLEQLEGDMEVTRQSTLIPQYPDKFYVESNPFIKVHFTRSKKTNKIISLLFNANEDESEEVIRAKRNLDEGLFNDISGTVVEFESCSEAC
ncbi:hypothetical protein [Reichenbachiella sp.]|uniref:hypothetical protein n=1 Tax=Reichenbachiella sp. TaxID=2184521 RepID=UPI003B5AED75